MRCDAPEFEVERVVEKGVSVPQSSARPVATLLGCQAPSR